MKEVFVLLADGDGTTRSIDTPWGAAVLTKEEAQRYVKEGGIGYTHSYTKVRIFETYEEARNIIYPIFDYKRYITDTNKKMQARNNTPRHLVK